MQFSFDPLIEQLYVNKVEVRDASGTLTAHRHDPSAYLADDRWSGLKLTSERGSTFPQCMKRKSRWRDRSRRQNQLIAGNCCSTTKRTSASDGTFDLLSLRRCGGGKVVRHAGAAASENGSCIPFGRRLAAGLQEQTDAGGGAAKYLPYLAIGGMATWEQEAKEYVQTIQSLLPVDSDVQKLSHDLTEGIDTLTSGSSAILRHQQQDGTLDTTFGSQGAHSAQTTHSKSIRYGVRAITHCCCGNLSITGTADACLHRRCRRRFLQRCRIGRSDQRQ